MYSPKYYQQPPPNRLRLPSFNTIQRGARAANSGVKLLSIDKAVKKNARLGYEAFKNSPTNIQNTYKAGIIGGQNLAQRLKKSKNKGFRVKGKKLNRALYKRQRRLDKGYRIDLKNQQSVINN